MNNRPNPNPSRLEVVHRHQETIKIFESKSDSEIWIAFNTFDEMAFNYLFRTYTPQLFRYGCQFRVEDDQVQDAIQNLFIYLRAKRGSLSPVNSIKAYLFKSLQHELIKLIKKEKKKVIISPDELEGNFLIEISIENSIIDNEEKQEQLKSLKQSIKKLSPRQRQAILLLYEDGLSYKDIAEVMEFSEVKSARKLIYRALDALRVNMGIDKKRNE
ncbi:RNA polymerase sigma factor [Algoriphagus formosus]|uniref:Sigma-70 family RNA polymerase sigma factor n=1 Tax=Algoriphagus formosus TaxID=2007308 RepID=A0A4R5V7M8_9BACT|nr:sigma-70 family RNA polymerase sigma factor [Algoriphagus aquimaris]TDK47944.1 sigma-70 family RNA polymerase sigma factor [Algoriphagus aquimaris]